MLGIISLARGLLIRLQDLSLSETLEVFELLTLTYVRYVDAPSREAVEAVGVELVRRDELRGTPEGEQDAERMGVAEQIIGWLWTEADRMSKRPTYVRSLIGSINQLN